MANQFGKDFCITTFGESHGAGVGVVIDGCPGGLHFSRERIQAFLDRRKPGKDPYTSPRLESDKVSILSGLEEERSLGSPICLLVQNQDARPSEYSPQGYRPSHADFTSEAKYSIRSRSGGGRASARETVGRVAAAALAEQLLEQTCQTPPQVVAFVETVKDIKANWSLEQPLDRTSLDAALLRCPDPQAAEKMAALISQAKANGDSVGGCILCVIKNPGVGLGEPIFDKLEADLAKAMLSIPACRGFEIGSGFLGTTYLGSEHNDAFFSHGGKIRTATNFSGGVQGGISNGEDIYFRVAFKPTATISKPQQSVDKEGKLLTLQNRGRHDPCVLPRAVPIVEAMALLVLADHKLRQMRQVKSEFRF